MKFVLLAAGKGHRLDMKITNKCFAPINNIPLINYSLELVLPQYFDELIIIVGHNAEYIMKYMGESYQGIKITYVYQEYAQLVSDNPSIQTDGVLHQQFFQFHSNQKSL